MQWQIVITEESIWSIKVWYTLDILVDQTHIIMLFILIRMTVLSPESKFDSNKLQ